jgi:antitoxin (DNA-binding transcriptional repressor) of toxin-antitoxin stability system
MAKIMTATEFRARCLGLFDWVARTGETIVITKRGKPVARLEQLPSEDESVGTMPGGYVAVSRPASDRKR